MVRDREGKRHQGIWIGAAVVLLAAILFLALRITNITVTGCSRYTSEQMEDLLFPGRWDKNSALCYLEDRFKPHRQIPFVEDYQFVFHSPTHLEVIVYEKNIVGYVSTMSSFMYFDRDGIVVESSSEKLEGVPLVTGLKFGSLIFHKPLPVEDPGVFQNILNLTQQLNLCGLQVDRIEYDSRSRATLYMDKMTVSLGNNDNMNSKISVLRDILNDQPQLSQMEGVIELEEYSETSGDGGITFRKK